MAFFRRKTKPVDALLDANKKACEEVVGFLHENKDALIKRIADTLYDDKTPKDLRLVK